jgi:hypothetical protein
MGYPVVLHGVVLLANRKVSGRQSDCLSTLAGTEGVVVTDP